MWNSFSMCSRQSEVVCCYFDKLQTAPTKTHLRTYMGSCTAKPANDSSVSVLDNRGLKPLHKLFYPIRHNVKTQLLIKADMTWLLPHLTTETQIIITPFEQYWRCKTSARQNILWDSCGATALDSRSRLLQQTANTLHYNSLLEQT